MADEATEGLLIGYARVSTQDQDAAMQVAALRKAGVDPDHIHVDQISGAKDVAKRPGLSAALRDARKGDTLVVWKLDRLGRKLFQVLQTIEDLDRRGIKLMSLTESFDGRTPFGRAMMGILLVFAQMERDLAVERTRAGLAKAIADGAKIGHPPKLVGERAERARELLAQPNPVKARIAKELGVSYATLRKFIKAGG